MAFCNFVHKFHVSAMSELKVTANFWKLGTAVPLDGGSMDISTCNRTKTNLMVFLSIPKFSDPK